MRTLALLLVASTLGACGATECRNYIRAQNQCAQDVANAGGSSPAESLAYDVVCLAFAGPFVQIDEETSEEWRCLTEAFNDSDCETQEDYDAAVAECDGSEDTDVDTDA